MSFSETYLPRIVYCLLSVTALYFTYKLGISPKSIFGAEEAEGTNKPKKTRHKKEEK